ncbi:MAG: hypothetical protein SNH27_16000 [Rikenellaceae bacterium]
MRRGGTGLREGLLDNNAEHTGYINGLSCIHDNSNEFLSAFRHDDFIELAVKTLHFCDVCNRLFQGFSAVKSRCIKLSDFMASLSTFVIPLGFHFGV